MPSAFLASAIIRGFALPLVAIAVIAPGGTVRAQSSASAPVAAPASVSASAQDWPCFLGETDAARFTQGLDQDLERSRQRLFDLALGNLQQSADQCPAVGPVLTAFRRDLTSLFESTLSRERVIGRLRTRWAPRWGAAQCREIAARTATGSAAGATVASAAAAPAAAAPSAAPAAAASGAAAPTAAASGDDASSFADLLSGVLARWTGRAGADAPQPDARLARAVRETLTDIKSDLDEIKRDANAALKAGLPPILERHRQAGLRAVDACIAEEEARLSRESKSSASTSTSSSTSSRASTSPTPSTTAPSPTAPSTTAPSTTASSSTGSSSTASSTTASSTMASSTTVSSTPASPSAAGWPDGLAIAPPSVFKVARGKPGEATLLKITSSVSFPPAANADGTLCGVGFRAAPHYAAMTQTQINEQVSTAEWPEAARAALGLMLIVESSQPVDLRGIRGMEFVAAPNAAAAAANPRSKHVRLFLTLFDTPKGRTSFSCATTADALPGALPLFRTIRDTLTPAH